MANSSQIRGAVVLGHDYSSPTNGRARRYLHPSSDGTAVFLGDFVKSGGSSDATYGCPTVIQAAAGDTLRGIVVGFDQVDGVAISSTNLHRNHCPASTAMYVYVVDDPNAIFYIQEDAVGATTALVDIGENADIIVGSGNSTTGLSAMQLDSSTHITATAQLRMLGFLADPSNTPASANAKVICTINEHELKSTTGV